MICVSVGVLGIGVILRFRVKKNICYSLDIWGEYNLKCKCCFICLEIVVFSSKIFDFGCLCMYFFFIFCFLNNLLFLLNKLGVKINEFIR